VIQIDVRPVLNQGQANEILRDYPRLYSKRNIINVSMTPIEFPGGWFMTIVYEIN
jgi:hypothetical protein